MFCYQCGAQIEDGLAFCTNCGTKLIKEETPQATIVASVQETEEPVINTYRQTVNTNDYGQNKGQNNTTYGQQELASPMKVNFVEAIKLYFINYANFTGRSTVSEYWWAYLFNYLASLALSFIPVVGSIATLGLLIPGIAISVRRLHDTGKAWTYLLMGLIPLAGPIILIIRYCKSSDADNQWGPAPKN